MDKDTYLKYLEILELDSLPQEFPSLAQVKSAYHRLKELYSFSEISVVTEPLEDEFSTNDRMEIIGLLNEAFEALIHFLVDKDRVEKEAFAQAGIIEDTKAEYFPPDQDMHEEEHAFAPDMTEEDLIPAEIDHSEISGELDLPEVEDLQADEHELSVTLADEEHHHIKIPPVLPGPYEYPVLTEEPEPEEEPKSQDEPPLPDEPPLLEEPSLPEEPPLLEEPEESEESEEPEEPEELVDDLPEPDEMEIEEISQEIEKAKTDPEELFAKTKDKADTTPKDPYVDTVPFPDADVDGTTIPLPPDLVPGPRLTLPHGPETETISIGPSGLLEGRTIKGRTLKKVREKLGLGIHEVAVSTRISYKILVNIEKERFAKLPEPGYLRWCISKYAKELTLDQKVVTDEYMKRFRQWQREQEIK